MFLKQVFHSVNFGSLNSFSAGTTEVTTEAVTKLKA